MYWGMTFKPTNKKRNHLEPLSILSQFSGRRVIASDAVALLLGGAQEGLELGEHVRLDLAELEESIQS